MKKISLVIFSLVILVSAFAQDYKKSPSIGVNFFLSDFQMAKDLRKNGLNYLINNRQLVLGKNLNPGAALSFLSGISKRLDFAATFGGSFVQYPFEDQLPSGNRSFLLESTAGINAKLLSDRYLVVPFLHVGIGGSKYKSTYAAFIPAGAGLQVAISDQIFLLLSSEYRIPVTETATYHFYHSMGIAGNIAKKKEMIIPKMVEIPIVEPPKDRDGDGIVDSLDACPDQAGPASLKGCPDRDGDGIADKDDECPDVPGLVKYKGCPIPDTDKDGINDEEDKCPTVPGVARYQGCPIPDTDGDGVNDEEDKCPNEAGPASNFGCPVIKTEIIEKVNTAAKNIFFATGSSKLLAKSFTSLNNVVQILKDNPTFKVDIEGHTDITGTREKNMILSDGRAASVKAYLVSKGIDESRTSSKGYGPDQPIADNKTSAGKAKNRRVEMKLRNY